MVAWGAAAAVAALFVLAGFSEIGGGWLVWKGMREPETLPRWGANRRKVVVAVGSVLLMLYGFLVTLQPLESFGRLFAAYGTIFIFMSIGWAAVFDGFRPDRYDICGALIAVVAAAVILFAPRGDGQDNCGAPRPTPPTPPPPGGGGPPPPPSAPRPPPGPPGGSLRASPRASCLASRGPRPSRTSSSRRCRPPWRRARAAGGRYRCRGRSCPPRTG